MGRCSLTSPRTRSTSGCPPTPPRTCGVCALASRRRAAPATHRCTGLRERPPGGCQAGAAACRCTHARRRRPAQLHQRWPCHPAMCAGWTARSPARHAARPSAALAGGMRRLAVAAGPGRVAGWPTPPWVPICWPRGHWPVFLNWRKCSVSPYRLPAQDGGKVATQGVEPDVLDGHDGLVNGALLAAPSGLADMDPVGGLVAGAAMAV